jgi:hypothetical protein
MPNIHPNGGSFTIPHQLHVDEHSFNGELLTTHASTERPAAECPKSALSTLSRSGAGARGREHATFGRLVVHSPAPISQGVEEGMLIILAKFARNNLCAPATNPRYE